MTKERLLVKQFQLVQYVYMVLYIELSTARPQLCIKIPDIGLLGNSLSIYNERLIPRIYEVDILKTEIVKDQFLIFLRIEDQAILNLLSSLSMNESLTTF